ncbi:ribonuclease HIII [Atopobacter phocae]|uniref:ribonuclease HIII n=1 Tax=Atopobacter phocae TaxID=136492 RepID=UPI0004ADA2F2|nr:ribonuclease HIII [Atopobacter phocae]
MNEVLVLKLNLSELNQLAQQLNDSIQSKPPHTIFLAKKDGHTITAYQSGKLMIQGPAPQQLAQDLGIQGDHTVSSPSKKSTRSKKQPLPADFDSWHIIGSDENGNGSYFGSVTVAATYVGPKEMKRLNQLGVRDSKTMTDTTIRQLAQEIKQTIPYELCIVPPQKYNEVIQTMSQHQMKAILHNHVLTKLETRILNDHQPLDGLLIDEFEATSTYLKHIKNEKKKTQSKLYSTYRAESEHLAVAAASIIARDAFLTSLETLGAPYQVILPSGASAQSDQMAATLIKKYGEEALFHTAKLHFKNTEKAKKLAR